MLPTIRLIVAACLPCFLVGCDLLAILGSLLQPVENPPTQYPSPASAQVVVNLQVDAEQDDVTGIKNITDELTRRNIPATIYVTADFANKNATLVQGLYVAGFEIALHGYYTGEQLATMTYDAQKDLLTRAKTAVEGCRPCGKYRPVIGFRPQYFSQNEDTYRVASELQLQYDSGFKAGLIPIPGYETKTVPFLLDAYGFYGVAFTVVNYADQNVYLCDIASATSDNLKLTSAQWSEVLNLGMTQAVARGEPLVVLLHGWYTGNQDAYDYWQPFIDLLDALGDQAAFVTTQELVDLYKSPSP